MKIRTMPLSMAIESVLVARIIELNTALLEEGITTRAFNALLWEREEAQRDLRDIRTRLTNA